MHLIIVCTVVIYGLMWDISHAWGVVAIAVERPPIIDGALSEWGGAHHLAIRPAADGVGLRGVFNNGVDYEVDVYLEWDAQYIYIAVVVEDDVLDVKRILPSQQEWKGASGQRKDRMFYYDHLKIFLRGPEAPLGYTIWISPGINGETPYAWGGRQRQPGSEILPVHLSTGFEPGLYTYEVAVPWEWLAIYPQSDMRLDGLFLFVDADDSELDIGEKVRTEKSNWIWWKGTIDLSGKPLDLKPPVQVAVETAAKNVLPQVADERLDDAIGRMRRKQAKAAAKAATESTQAQVVIATVKNEQENPSPISQTESTISAKRETTEQTASVRALLNRRLLAKRPIPELPRWVLACNVDSKVRRTQLDSLVFQLKATLYRLFHDKINSRTDGLVMNIAEYAGTRRNQARPFLEALLNGLVHRFKDPEESVYQTVVTAAQRAEVDAPKALHFIIAMCELGEKGYREQKVSTTVDLIKKSRREAGLEDIQVRALLDVLLENWSG